ncbi:MAG: hypothetical protein WBZ48_00605 [Bacteroidota bacterium]
MGEKNPLLAVPTSYQALVQHFAAPPGKTYLLYGEKPIFLLSLRIAAHGMALGSSVAVVDGCNRFNVHFLSQFARERKLNIDDFLHRIFVSRGFTCYQMEQAIVHRLPLFLGTINSRTAMVFGLLDTFYDQQAPLGEVRQILHRVIAAFQEMKTEGISILLVCKKLNVLPKERNELFTTLQAGVDTVYRLQIDDGMPKLFLEKGVLHDGTYSANVYEHYRQRDGKLVEIPPRPSKRRPGAF